MTYAKTTAVQLAITQANHSNTNNEKKMLKHLCEVLPWLLSKQFPEGKGLYSVLAFEGENPKVEKGLNDFVQIINVSAQHWVTVSNVGCEDNSFNVFRLSIYGRK